MQVKRKMAEFKTTVEALAGLLYTQSIVPKIFLQWYNALHQGSESFVCKGLGR